MQGDTAEQADIRAEAAKQEADTARAMLRTEKAANVELARAVSIHVDGLVGRVVMADPTEDDDPSTYQQIDHTHRGMASGLAALLLLYRGRARRAGMATLGAATGLMLSPAVMGAQQDHTRSSIVGAALASQWASLALSVIRPQGEDDTSSLAKRLAGTSVLMGPRVERTAATEVVDAFNNEREQIARAFDGGVWRVWSAVLDRRVCPTCGALDGKMIGPGDSFGVMPPVHPLCRCLVLYVRR